MVIIVIILLALVCGLKSEASDADLNPTAPLPYSAFAGVALDTDDGILRETWKLVSDDAVPTKETLWIIEEAKDYDDDDFTFDESSNYTKPTSAPTSVPTSVPTSKPTSLPTSIPTSIPTSTLPEAEEIDNSTGSHLSSHDTMVLAILASVVAVLLMASVFFTFKANRACCSENSSYWKIVGGYSPVVGWKRAFGMKTTNPAPPGRTKKARSKSADLDEIYIEV